MKDDTIVYVALIGVGGYFLYKSDFFKGLGQVSTGIGEGVSGIGGGVSTAFQGAGQGIADISSGFAAGVNSVLDLVNPLGALGNQIANNINAVGQNQERSLRREAEQANTIDVSAFDLSKNQIANITAEKDIFNAQQGSLRNKDWQQTKTELSDFGTDLISPSKWAQAGSTLVKASPAFQITSWISSQVSKLKTPAVQSVSVSSTQTNSSSIRTPVVSSSKTSAQGSTSIFSISGQNKALEALGFQGQSTRAGIVYTAPASIRTPVKATPAPAPAKKWYNPRSWFR